MSDHGIMKNEYRRLADGRQWFGYLTLDNIDAVTERLRALIGDGQPYVWVATNELFGLRPEVRTGQVVETITVKRGTRDSGREYGHLIVTDTHGVWGLSTEAADQRQAGQLDERDRQFLSVERDRIRVEHHALGGNRLCWTIAVEAGAA